jgi:hypothetical protein
MPLLSLFGLKHCFVYLEFLISLCEEDFDFGVIILVLPISLQIPSFMLGSNPISRYSGWDDGDTLGVALTLGASSLE